MSKSNKKCSTCVYRASRSAVWGCNYILIERHMRGCPATECDKYVKGKRITLEDK